MCRTALLIVDSTLTNVLPYHLGDCRHSQPVIVSKHDPQLVSNLINGVALGGFYVNDLLRFGAILPSQRDPKSFRPGSGTCFLERNTLQIAKVECLCRNVAVKCVFVAVTPAARWLKRHEAPKGFKPSVLNKRAVGETQAQSLQAWFGCHDDQWLSSGSQAIPHGPEIADNIESATDLIAHPIEKPWERCPQFVDGGAES